MDFRLADNSETLGLKFSGPNNCSLEVGLICDSSMATGAYNTTPVVLLNNSTCQYSTQMTSKNNCPVYSLNALW